MKTTLNKKIRCFLFFFFFKKELLQVIMSMVKCQNTHVTIRLYLLSIQLLSLQFLVCIRMANEVQNFKCAYNINCALFFFLACTTSKLFEYSLKEELFLLRISSELPSVKILPFKSLDYIVIILPC